MTTDASSSMRVWNDSKFSSWLRLTCFYQASSTRSFNPTDRRSAMSLLIFSRRSNVSLQADWTPPITPALWARLPDDHIHEDHPAPQKCDTYDKPSYQAQSSHPNQNVQIDQEERKKNWYDLDDHRKKELEVYID